MNLKDVLKECPKAAEKYYEFAGRALQGLQKLMAGEIPSDMEQELPEIDQDIIRGYAENLLDVNHRNLFDFFDEQEVYTSVWKNASYWDCNVVENSNVRYEELGLATRFMTENAVFIQSFKVLEEKLNK